MDSEMVELSKMFPFVNEDAEIQRAVNKSNLDKMLRELQSQIIIFYVISNILHLKKKLKELLPLGQNDNMAEKAKSS